MAWPLRCSECGTLFSVNEKQAICPHCDQQNWPYLYAVPCPFCHQEESMTLTYSPILVDFDLPYVCEHCLKGIDGADWPYKPPDTTDPLVDGGIWPYPASQGP